MEQGAWSKSIQDQHWNPTPSSLLHAPGYSAVGEGFEPPVPFGTPVFKTGALDHSATQPYVVAVRYG